MYLLTPDTSLSTLNMILAPESCGCPFRSEGVLGRVGGAVCPQLGFLAVLVSFLNGRCDVASPCDRLPLRQTPDDQYDFIVVGAGTAGSIVAARLAETNHYKVLLVEAGGEEPVGVRVPGMYRAYWGDEVLDWRYSTTHTQNYCLDTGGRCVWPRGKGIGGTSLLNGMMYHRGHRADYDQWAAGGAAGWAWDDVTEYLDRSEDNLQVNSLVSPLYHSTAGQMPVQTFRYQPQFVSDLIASVEESGLPVIDDLSDPNTPAGVTVAQTFSRNGQRVTTARGYLEGRSWGETLHVVTGAHVTRVEFNNTGNVVHYLNNGVATQVRATKEVLLCAGALNTPQILMLSGVGPKQDLTKLKIPLVSDLPVGQTLKNHVGMTLYFLLEPVERNELDWSTATQYLLSRSGPLSATGATQTTGLLYSSLTDPADLTPDLQFFFNGFYAECSLTGAINETLTHGHTNISVNAVALAPRSVGTVRLTSNNPLTPPEMDPNYFTHPDDMIMVKDAARYVRQMLFTQSMKEKYGIRLDPSYGVSCNKSGAEWSDPWLECMARLHTDPQNHQASTAPIGPVLHSDLTVRGVTGLRVIDASSMPAPPTGNPQGAIMMVAEKGAQLVIDTWA